MPVLGRGFIPIERVKDLSSKGFSEVEMIDILRKEGFSAEEIDKGLTEALKSAVSQETPTFPQKQEEKKQLPTIEEITPRQEIPSIPETSLPEAYYYPEYSTEDYVDYLIKEKTKDIEEKINIFSMKFNELEKKVESMYGQINYLAKTKPEEQQLIITKIENFKETVDDVNVRLSGLERAFKETLPALIESVRALSDLVQRLKKEV